MDFRKIAKVMRGVQFRRRWNGYRHGYGLQGTGTGILYIFITFGLLLIGFPLYLFRKSDRSGRDLFFLEPGARVRGGGSTCTHPHHHEQLTVTHLEGDLWRAHRAGVQTTAARVRVPIWDSAPLGFPRHGYGGARWILYVAGFLVIRLDVAMETGRACQIQLRANTHHVAVIGFVGVRSVSQIGG